MRCPTLADLPPPPPGKAGWPWTAESPQLPDTMPDGSPWPRISIVTPSYNQGAASWRNQAFTPSHEFHEFSRSS